MITTERGVCGVPRGASPWSRLRLALALPRALWFVYVVTFLAVGTAMNAIGTAFEIARFTHVWQIATVYLGIMLPIALMLRGRRWGEQYANALLPVGLMELGGYALRTSHAYPDNVLDRVLGERNFSLAMTLLFAGYIPLLNALVRVIHARITPRG